MKINKQKGSITIVLIIIVLLIIGIGSYVYLNDKKLLTISTAKNEVEIENTVSKENNNSTSTSYKNGLFCDDTPKYQETDNIFECNIDDNLVFVYFPKKNSEENRVEIKRKSDNKTINTFYTSDYNSESYDFVFDIYLDSFEFVDINFDGVKDLQVLNSSGAYNQMYDFYVYDIDEGVYKLESSLKDLVNASFREEKGEGYIFEFSKGRGFADIYSTSDYKYNKQILKYEEIERCTREFLSQKFSEEDGYYYYCEKPNDKNEWKLSTLNFDGVGDEYVRSCPTFDCSVIKYGAYIPEIEFIKKEKDWYEVNYIEKGDWVVDGVVELSESQWVKTTGWIYESNVPKVIQDLINEHL